MIDRKVRGAGWWWRCCCDSDRKRRRLIKCHRSQTRPKCTLKTTKTTTSQSTLLIFLIMILTLTWRPLRIAGQLSSSNFMFADLSNAAIEDDELSKTLDGSGNGDEWNLNHVTTGSQLPPTNQDEQQRTNKWLPATMPTSNSRQQDDGLVSIGDRSFTITLSGGHNHQLNEGPNKRIDTTHTTLDTTIGPRLMNDLNGNEFISVVNNQSNIVYTEPIEDVIKYSASERSSTSFAAGSYANSSFNNHTALTRYGWKSHNNEPIVSIIKLSNTTTNNSNNNNSSSNVTPRIMTIHLNEASGGKSNQTRLSVHHNNEDEERNKIYKSYSVVDGASKRSHPMIGGLNNSNNNNGTLNSNKMISYSPTPVQITRPASGGDGGGSGQENSADAEHHVVLTVANSLPLNHHPQSHHHHPAPKLLRAPLIITQDQLRMIAESEDPPLDHLSYRAYRRQKADNERQSGRQYPVKDSFMFDASLLPAMTMSLASPSSSSVSASELIPQTASNFDPPQFESDFKKTLSSPPASIKQIGDRDQHINFRQTNAYSGGRGGGHDLNPQQLGSNSHENELHYEPIVVETSPEVSSLDGAQVSAQLEDSKEEPGNPEHGANSDASSDINLDTSSQDDSFGDESHLGSSSLDNDLPFDSDDQQLNSSSKSEGGSSKMKAPDSKPTKLDVKYQRRKRKRKKKQGEDDDRKHQEQQQPEEASKSKQTPGDQELLVGPFKSESEAPATITLAGVVYQKQSGSSSQATIVKSHLNSSPPQKQFSSSGPDMATGTGNGAQQMKQASTIGPQTTSAGTNSIEKYWPYTSVYVPPSSIMASSSSQSSAQQQQQQRQLASIGDILLGSMKNGERTSGDPIRIQQPSSSASSAPDGGLRLSPPFSFSPGALLAASSNTNTNTNHLHQHLPQLQSGSSSSNPQFDLDLLNPPSELMAKMMNLKHTSMSPSEVIASMLLESAASSAATTTSGSSGGQLDQTTAMVNPVWASSSNKGEQYYLGNLNSASTDGSYHHVKHHGKEKHAAQGPIVIVQKDVKPVKYHLLRAYLKLRRLLRPFEATYVFPNDGPSLIRRRGLKRLSIRASRLGNQVAAAGDSSSLGPPKKVDELPPFQMDGSR